MSAIAVFVLAVKLFNFSNMEVASPALRADALQYVNMAINIGNYGIFADGLKNGSLEVNRLPGYPLLLSVVWKLSNNNIAYFYQNALLLNVVLGVLSVLLMYLICYKHFNQAVAVILSILVALYPHLLSLEGYVLTESIFTFELLLLVWLIQKAAMTSSRKMWVLIGAVIGYSLLTRPAFILFLPFLAMFLLLSNSKWFESKMLLTFGLLGCVLITAPWAIYTASKGIPFSGTKKDSGTLTEGFYPNLVYKNPIYYGFPYRDPESPDIHYDTKKALAQLWEWTKQEPVKYFSWFLVGKPITLWQWNIIQGEGNVFIYPVKSSPFKDNLAFKAICALYRFLHPVMVILMFIGAGLAIFRRNSLLEISLAAVIVYFVLIHMIFVSLPRYSVPLRPLMLILDVSALQYLLSAQFRQQLQSLHLRLQRLRNRADDANSPVVVNPTAANDEKLKKSA